MRIFGAPGIYIQGPGAIDRLGDLVATLGTRVLLVSDEAVLRMIGPRVERALAGARVAFASTAFTGEVTGPNVERLVAETRVFAADVVIAAGGGKGVDAGKAVSRALGARLVTLPTAASNDGPTSRIYILYDDHHRLVSAERVPRNPDAVVVDTDVIIGAPPDLLVSGIGDALVKLYEATQCIGAGGANMFGGMPTIAAFSLAQACDRTLREHAPAALAAAKAGRSNDGYERVIEACFLLAGLAFEGCGLSIAHAMTRGLSAVPQTAAALHGRQVAYALLVQFVLEKRPDDFLAGQHAFYRLVGLPRSLAELGLTAPSAADLGLIAELTIRAPHTRNFERPLAEGDLIEAMRTVEEIATRGT